MQNSNSKTQQNDNETLNTLGKNLSHLMIKKDIDSAFLSNITGLGVATINSLRRGSGNPTLATIVSLAHFFDVSLSELTETDLDRQQVRPNRAQTMPLIKLGEIDRFLDNSLKNHAMYSTEIDATENHSVIAILIHNNALYPHFSSGTICIISMEEEPCDGDIVLIKINDFTPCFRRLYIEDDNFLFTTITLEHDVKPSSYKNANILGILLKAIKNYV
ncbi:helix-turn-helix domain-containing protein [Acerihabitans sp. TG2]|uniref:helix-turn-helix domain-containing protein n=1 Tax=Acerihabitans sp. TG2 TaxID=3096008 RepID=UPI002B23A273|nr:helix-turn-helix domain-containing protein [Acerihabitans sp. TG2]MEA9391459.1 helix-turn-helix domain-containing protein [Acerihabitans sp. TG2]